MNNKATTINKYFYFLVLWFLFLRAKMALWVCVQTHWPQTGPQGERYFKSNSIKLNSESACQSQPCFSGAFYALWPQNAAESTDKRTMSQNYTATSSSESFFPETKTNELKCWGLQRPKMSWAQEFPAYTDIRSSRPTKPAHARLCDRCVGGRCNLKPQQKKLPHTVKATS